MKRTWLVVPVLVAGIAIGFFAGRGGARGKPGGAGSRTFSAWDRTVAGEPPIAAQGIRFQDAPLGAVLEMYAELSKRSIIPGTNLPAARISFVNQAAMSRVEALQALDTVLAAQGIVMVCNGPQFAKVLTPREAVGEAGPVWEGKAEELPESSSYVVYAMKLKKLRVNEAAMAAQPFAKLPNSVIVLGPGGGPATVPGLAGLPAKLMGGKNEMTVILRDYASNVRRMAEVLEKLEQSR